MFERQLARAIVHLFRCLTVKVCVCVGGGVIRAECSFNSRRLHLRLCASLFESCESFSASRNQKPVSILCDERGGNLRRLSAFEKKTKQEATASS